MENRYRFKRICLVVLTLSFGCSCAGACVAGFQNPLTTDGSISEDDQSEMAAMIALLRSVNVQERDRASLRLKEGGVRWSEYSIGILKLTCGDEDPDVRLRAQSAL